MMKPLAITRPMPDAEIMAPSQPVSLGPLASLSLSMLMPSLGISVAQVALPNLAQAFDASFQAVQWIVLAYLLAITALIVSVGRLGDLIGRRRLLLIGISVFTVASFACGAAPTLGVLIAARAVQGLGAAMMMALTLALVGATMPKNRTGQAMGWLGTMSAIGTALGPSLGGFLIAGLGWRAIFFVNLPLGLLSLLFARRFLPVDGPSVMKLHGVDKAPGARSGLDPLGSLLLALTLAAYALAMTIHGHFGVLHAALLGVAGVGAGLFLWVESRVASPLVRLSMLRDPLLSAGLAMSALVSTVMMATLVLGPFYLSRALGLNAASVGIALSVGPMFSALTGVLAGRLVDRLGPARVTTVGLCAMVLGCLVLCLVPMLMPMAAPSLQGYVGPIVVLTVGYALFQTANNTSAMAEVRGDQRGVVSGLLQLSRHLGLITGSSVMGAVFAFASAASDITAATPGAVNSGMQATFAVAAVLIALALAIARGTSRHRRSLDAA